MNEIKKIVLPTDFSEASLSALDWVNHFAVDDSVEVHCINVVQHPVIYMPVESPIAPPTPDVEELKEVASSSLDAFVTKYLTNTSGKLIKKALVGRPSEKIADYADDISADMIIMATRGQGGLAHLLLGSTTEGVVRQAKCPVLTVK